MKLVYDFIKKFWTIILAITGGIIGVVEFIQLWQGQRDIVTWVMGIGGFFSVIIVVIFIGFCKQSSKYSPPFKKRALVLRFPKLYIVARIGLFILVLTAIYGAWSLYQKQQKLEQKIIVAIADFYGPDQDNYQITPDLIGKISDVLKNNNVQDTEVIPLMQVITEANGGSGLARELGEKKLADLVIWGRYSIDDEDVFLTMYVENLSNLEFLSLEESTMAEILKFGKKDKFEFRQELSGEMSAFALFISALGHYENRNFVVAYNRLNSALFQTQWNEQVISKKYPLVYRTLARFALTPLDASELGISDEDRLIDGIKDLSKALEVNPDDPSVYFALAFIYMISGRNEDAIENYEIVLDYEPDNADALHNLGLTYYLAGQLENAKDALMKAVQLDPNYVLAWHHLGNAYEDLGEFQQAIDSYTSALEINPNYPAALNDRGLLYSSLGEYEDAERDFDRLISVENTTPLAYTNRGIVYLNREKWDEAISDFGKALELNPNFEPAFYQLYNLGYISIELGNHEVVIDSLSLLIKYFPETAAAYLYRGVAYVFLEKYDLAVLDLQKVVDISADQKMIGEAKNILIQLEEIP